MPKRSLSGIAKASQPDSKDATLLSVDAFRRSLPVFAYRAQLLEAITVSGNEQRGGDVSRSSVSTHGAPSPSVSSLNTVILVTAETGSGKSTQIPVYVLEHIGRPLARRASWGQPGNKHNFSSTSSSSTYTYNESSSAHGNDQLVRIAVTQPRRVAAITLAQRVAVENRVRCGQRIGYRVRFQDCTSPTETQLIYLTDGMLLREAMIDPTLSAYSVVFLDECHERSLPTDILIGVVQRARRARSQSTQNLPPLQVVLMSATLELETFRNYFGTDQIRTIHIPGRTFPVQVLYTTQPMDDYVEAALSTIVQIHENEEAGDILVFLAGQDEIESLTLLLQQYLQAAADDEQHIQQQRNQWVGDRVEVWQPRSQHHSVSNRDLVNGVLLCPLYAALPPEAQMVAFEDKPLNCTRKIVLATNIAETSVTIPDVRYVVDTGKCKSRQTTTTGMECLVVENVSQAAAAQRAGRAGRVQAGLCFRLYTESALEALPPSTPPEIVRVNLAQVVLQLKGMGITDPTTFEFVTPPERSSLIRATKLLYALSALDEKMELTTYGTKLAKLPLDPTFGHLLLQSVNYGCSKDMLTAVAVLSAEHVFYQPPATSALGAKASASHRRFASHEGDLPTFVNVYTAWLKEATFTPRDNGSRLGSKTSSGRIAHTEWCMQNFISGRSLVRAYDIREQLHRLCSRPTDKNGLGMDMDCGGSDTIAFLKCVAGGLFMQAASRMKTEDMVANKTLRGRYQTKLGRIVVSIHPTSTLFARQPAPACVVYCELVTTTRTYIRGVTQIREEWLQQVAPSFYT